MGSPDISHKWSSKPRKVCLSMISDRTIYTLDKEQDFTFASNRMIGFFTLDLSIPLMETTM